MRTRAGRRWSKTDDESLRSVIGAERIGRKIHRTKGAVYSRRNVLGIVTRRDPRIAELAERYGIGENRIRAIGVEVILATPEEVRTLRFGWKDSQVTGNLL